MARKRPVQVHLSPNDRRCLYCLGDGPSTQDEHVIPAAFGLPQTKQWIIPPGTVCDACNGWLGAQVDAPFTHRFDLTLARALGGVAGRAGRIDLIDGRNATAVVDLTVGGRTVKLFASKAEQTADGGLEFEVQPKTRDPQDVVARTIRALWKMALGALWHGDPPTALGSDWDHLRVGALGHPLKGYVLQRPMVVQPIERVHLNVSGQTAKDPGLITFVAGGVILAAPLTPGHEVDGRDLIDAGWEIHSTDDRAPNKIRLRLHPHDVEDAAASEGSGNVWRVDECA